MMLREREKVLKKRKGKKGYRFFFSLRMTETEEEVEGKRENREERRGNSRRGEVEEEEEEVEMIRVCKADIASSKAFLIISNCSSSTFLPLLSLLVLLSSCNNLCNSCFTSCSFCFDLYNSSLRFNNSASVCNKVALRVKF